MNTDFLYESDRLRGTAIELLKEAVNLLAEARILHDHSARRALFITAFGKYRKAESLMTEGKALSDHCSSPVYERFHRRKRTNG